MWYCQKQYRCSNTIDLISRQNFLQKGRFSQFINIVIYFESESSKTTMTMICRGFLLRRFTLTDIIYLYASLIYTQVIVNENKRHPKLLVIVLSMKLTI